MTEADLYMLALGVGLLLGALFPRRK